MSNLSNYDNEMKYQINNNNNNDNITVGNFGDNDSINNNNCDNRYEL